MKRGGTLRRTPMPARSKPMARAAITRISAPLYAQISTHNGPVPPRRKPSRDTGFPPPVRKLIDWRDSDYGQLPAGFVRCQCCGRVIRKQDGSRQHRISRHAGGTRNPVISSAVNGTWMCGSATTPRSCHQWAESRHPDAYDRGFWRRQDEAASLPFIPVIRWDGRAYYPTADGHWVAESPAGVL